MIYSPDRLVGTFLIDFFKHSVNNKIMAKKTITNTSATTRKDLGYLGIDFQHKLVKLFIEDPSFFTTINPKMS